MSHFRSSTLRLVIVLAVPILGASARGAEQPRQYYSGDGTVANANTWVYDSKCDCYKTYYVWLMEPDRCCRR